MKEEKITVSAFLGVILVASLFSSCVNSPRSEILPAAPHSEVALPQTEITRKIGRHDLPFQPNERFILESVFPERGVDGKTDLIIVYFLDGRRREWAMGGPRSTDGYVTELGWFMESSSVDGNFMEERVVSLPTGEQITVRGNSVQSGGVRLRALESSGHEAFGRSSIADFVENSGHTKNRDKLLLARRRPGRR